MVVEMPGNCDVNTAWPVWTKWLYLSGDSWCQGTESAPPGRWHPEAGESV